MSTSDTSGFGQFVPGFEFMQNLARQATGGLAQGVQQAVPQMPHLGNWVAPTFSVEDLEKRIQELKAVHFWLDQNARALSATIQALEVQKMTLATLQGMNLSLGDVANALKVKATDTMASMAGFAGMGSKPSAAEAADPSPPVHTSQFAGLEIPPRRAPAAAPEAPAPAPPPAAPPEASAAATPAPAPGPGAVDPMQWWGALSKQFQAIAATALKDVGEVAPTTQPVAKPPRKAAATSAKAPTKTGAAKSVATSGTTPAAKATRQPAKAPATPKAARKTTGRAR